MKKNNIILILSVIVIIAIVVYILVPTGTEQDSFEPNPDEKPENKTPSMLSDIESYIQDSDAIIKKLQNSEDYKNEFKQWMQNEPAFTGNFTAESFESDMLTEIILSFSSNFQTPEIFPNLVKLIQGNSSSSETKKKARGVLAAGGDAALESIYQAFYDEKTGVIENLDGLRWVLQGFSHYWQLKFWGNHFFVSTDSPEITKNAKNEFGNTTVTNSPASIKVLIQLLKDLESNEQKKLVLMNMSKTRIPPQWNEWFIPMFADAIASLNTVKIDEIWPNIKEILTVTRRAGIINQFNTWLKKNPRETFGFKILVVAVKQAMVELKRWNIDSINSDEPTKQPDAPDPDEKLDNPLNPIITGSNSEKFESLRDLYHKYNLFSEFSVKPDLYNVEKFGQLRKYLFAKPVLFEIAMQAGIVVENNTWQNLFYNNLMKKDFITSEQHSKLENSQQKWLEYLKIHADLSGFNNSSTKQKVEIFAYAIKPNKTSKSILDTLLYEIKVEILCTNTTQAEFTEILTKISEQSISENKLADLLQVAALKKDKFWKNGEDFQPFEFLISKSIISDWNQILSNINLPKHKFAIPLLKNLMTKFKTDFPLMKLVFKKLNGFSAKIFEAEIADFLESQNSELKSSAILMLPAKKKYFILFAEFMKSANKQVKQAAAIRLLEQNDEQIVLSALVLLKKTDIKLLAKNLYRIKNTKFLAQQVLDLQKELPDLMSEILVKRPEILTNEAIFSASFEIFTSSEKKTKQIKIMSALFTRKDKINDVLMESATMQNYDVRQAAWEFALNHDENITEEYLLLLLDNDYYLTPQNVMLYFVTKPSWISKHEKIKERVIKFLEKKHKFKLELSASLALLEVESEDIAIAFCNAIDNRVIWPVAYQIWNYLINYKNLDVSLIMLDILTNEEKSGTSFATSYLSKYYNDFPELKSDIYKNYPKLKLFKTTFEFLKIFEKNKDKNAVSIIVAKDYSILPDIRGIDKNILPKEVSQKLSSILEIKPPVEEKTAKNIWKKYISNN